MARGTTARPTFRLLLLFTIFVFGVVGSKDDQASLGASLIITTTPRTSTNDSYNPAITRDNGAEKSSSSVKSVQDVKAKEIEWDEDDDDDDDGDEEEEDEEEYGEANESGVEVDEYEDELREIAESHEAMLRDESKNRLSNATSLARSSNENPSFSIKNFDSRENSNEIVSNEKFNSNEAAAKDDEEVAELLRYKQKAASSSLEEKPVSGIPELGAKVKRVPTVKKELSTQKEILNANETQLSLPKTLVSNVEIVNRLDDEENTDAGFGLAHADPNRFELVGDETRFDEEYPIVETSDDIIRKLDKRRPYDLEAMKSYITGGYNSKQERRGELGDDESGPEDDLIDLLGDMYEHPELFLKLYQIFASVMDVPKKNGFRESPKRSDASDSLIRIPMTVIEPDMPETASTTKKPKKKKKKKKPRQRLPKTTPTSEPPITTAPKTPIDSSPTPAFLATTAANWPETTQAQWRLVAERLFGDPWSVNHRAMSPDTAKIRSIDEKQRVNLKTLNDERQALMLESARREYSQPRRLHYGKVNTHEKGSPNSNDDNTIRNYDSSRNIPTNDYELSERRFYQPRPLPLDRYDYYRRQMMRHYGSVPIEAEHGNDYDEISRSPHDIIDHRPFAKTHQFKPLGREYASTKTWQDSRYDYARPWKDKSRIGANANTDRARNWPWKITPRDYKIWIPNYRQSWSRDSNYWQRLSRVENELNELLNADINEKNSPLQSQQRQRQQQRQTSWRPQHDESGGWKIDQNVDVESWKLHNRPKIHSHGIVPLTSLEKSKNRSELSDQEIVANPAMKDKPILPKITMKTWNSLTSDPATWPFKLNGAKPWPKDKNGNSYNPNAELVRKLGLDKQDRLLSSSEDNANDIDEGTLTRASESNKIVGSTKIGSDNRNDVNSMANPVKSSIDWPEKLDAVSEWMDKSRNGKDGLAQRDQPRQLWQSSLDNDKKMWSDKSPISPKISSVGAWIMPADQSTWRPFDLKHKAYDQRPDNRLSRTWNEPTNSDETDGNSWRRKNDVISSGGWHEKNNDWNVVRPVVYPSDKSASTINSSTWPSKWRQFAYHKVTAAPIAKPGSLNVVDGSIRPRNSYIAVSAVSPPKYINNDWRKNDIEEIQLDRTSDVDQAGKFHQDDPTNQLRKSLTNQRWNQEPRKSQSKDDNRRRNDNDPLEHQLEELRREPYWNHDQLHQQSQKRSNTSGNSSITAVTTQATQIPLKSSSQDNAILNSHVESINITKSRKQEEKNVTQ